MSSVNAPGSALNASRSSRSPSTGSPRIPNDCSNENMYSTTAHSSDPCDGFGPARCSSHENIPLGSPWYLSSEAIIRSTSLRSASEPETSDHTGPVLMACPLFTPCVASAKSLSPPPSLTLAPAPVVHPFHGNLGSPESQSYPCVCSSCIRSSSFALPVRL